MMLVFFTYIITLNNNYLSINFLKDTFMSTKDIIQKRYYFYLLVFFLLYFFTSAFSLPLAGAFSIFIGAIFYFIDAVFIVILASSLGALVSFFIARFTMKEYLEVKFKKQLKKINNGIKVNGISYLFFLRLVPIFPFFLINLIFGITKMSPIRFYFVSLAGMFPGTILYVNAGTQIADLKNFEEIYNLKILISFLIIGIFPITLKKVLYYIKLFKN